jgi:hypothetical protein
MGLFKLDYSGSKINEILKKADQMSRGSSIIRSTLTINHTNTVFDMNAEVVNANVPCDLFVGDYIIDTKGEMYILKSINTPNVENNLIEVTYTFEYWGNVGGIPGPQGEQGPVGPTGVKLVSQEFQGKDKDGGNVYLFTFDDGSTSTIVIPASKPDTKYIRTTYNADSEIKFSMQGYNSFRIHIIAKFDELTKKFSSVPIYISDNKIYSEDPEDDTQMAMTSSGDIVTISTIGTVLEGLPTSSNIYVTLFNTDLVGSDGVSQAPITLGLDTVINKGDIIRVEFTKYISYGDYTAYRGSNGEYFYASNGAAGGSFAYGWNTEGAPWSSHDGVNYIPEVENDTCIPATYEFIYNGELCTIVNCEAFSPFCVISVIKKL